MFLIVLSILGVFSTILWPLVLLIILEYLICRYLYKFSLIIPICSLGYLFYIELSYFRTIYPIIELNQNYLWYGILLIIPYSTFFISTTMIYYHFRKKVHRQKELNKIKISDL